jgi:endo-beta-N-acetylglucosaminidase D
MITNSQQTAKADFITFNPYTKLVSWSPKTKTDAGIYTIVIVAVLRDFN